MNPKAFRSFSKSVKKSSLKLSAEIPPSEPTKASSIRSALRERIVLSDLAR